MPGEIIRQQIPGPTCGARNIFSGFAVGLGTGRASRAAARRAASEANRLRARAMAEDRARDCPASCPRIGRPITDTVGSGGLMASFEANPDADRWVAFFYKEWAIEIRCAGSFQPRGLALGQTHKSLEHIEPLVCGATRTSGGVVLARSFSSSATASLRTARARATRERDRILRRQLRRRCPRTCPGLAEIVDMSEGGRAIELQLIRQARGPRRRQRWVRFYAAWWTVTHRCAPMVEKKRERRKPRKPRKNRIQRRVAAKV